MKNSSSPTVFILAIVVAIVALIAGIYYLIPGIPHVLASPPTAVHVKHAVLFFAIAIICVIGALVTRPRAA
ncbi:hypothetical protein [Thermogemmatispora tikiterensis]|uniref:Uncharacterized protein n=1 Tax=Thermogemmatispora tikiterensis TaxID=1825093 RepID=A0A328VHJ3_9CHLR|nr:hypothetical protein [Thermogemmatispora tikiterensis]RAQ96351.1 hypothetical protein A4R35_12465 [Thermogemmatispora tikiterensis]